MILYTDNYINSLWCIEVKYTNLIFSFALLSFVVKSIGITTIFLYAIGVFLSGVSHAVISILLTLFIMVNYYSYL